jgi:DNA-binding transcriptional MerR regulator
MFRIGHFARLGQVSVKTLRWYDELGLLRPRHSDPATGYRYYTADQLPRLNRILALKGMGLSLEQIAPLLDGGLPAAELRGMLRLKRAELQQHIGEEQERLAQVEARLRQIEDEDGARAHDVVVQPVPPQPVAAIRATLSAFPDVGHLTAEIYRYLRPYGLDGLDGAVWYDMGHESDEGIDAEGVVYVDRPVPSTQRIRVHALPAVERMAWVVHHGPYRALHQAYTALHAWIEAGGYHAGGPSREVYLHGGESQDDPNYVTRVGIPVLGR